MVEKVLISDKYFYVYRDICNKFTTCLREYIFNKGFRRKEFTIHFLILVTCVKYQKIEKQVV